MILRKECVPDTRWRLSAGLPLPWELTDFLYGSQIKHMSDLGALGKHLEML